MNDLPERINVIRTVSYYVPDIVEQMCENNDNPDYDPDIEEIIDYIQDWVAEDHSSYPSRHDLVYQDENGNEL